jgi:glycosyltransferase involved in cell wall biosynthesis
VIIRSQQKDPPVLLPIDLGLLPAKPLVSVIICNYNYESYIGQSIESVLNQTYENLELVVCDDGSTDDSVAVIRRYLGDARVRLLEKQNGGQATGFNASWRQTRGEIVCFLDADDFYLPTKLERVVESAKANPGCGCVLNGWLRVDKDLVPQGTMPLLASIPAGWQGNEVLKSGGILDHVPSTPGLNLRREVAEVLFPLPVEQPLDKFPDMVMMRLVPLLCRLSAVNEPLAVVRLHGGNTYQTERVTSASIQREMSICQELWEEQRRRLDGIGPRLGETLTPLDSAPIIIRQKYIWFRLARMPDRWVYYNRLLKVLGEHGQWMQWACWGATAFLPHWVFEKTINLALTQNRLKQNILRLKGFHKKMGRNKREAARKVQAERKTYGNMSTPERRNTCI